MSHYYRERHEGAAKQSESEQTQALPRTHADLDTLANERGHTWTADDLTVAQKQAELDAA